MVAHTLLRLREMLYGKVQITVAVGMAVAAMWDLLENHGRGEWWLPVGQGVLVGVAWWAMFCWFVPELFSKPWSRSRWRALDWSAREVQIFAALVSLVASPVLAVAQNEVMAGIAALLAVGGLFLFATAWVFRATLDWASTQPNGLLGILSAILVVPVPMALYGFALFRVGVGYSCGCEDPKLQWILDTLGCLFLSQIFAAVGIWPRIPLWARILTILATLQITLTYSQFLFPVNLPDMWGLSPLSALAVLLFLAVSLNSRRRSRSTQGIGLDVSPGSGTQ